MSARLVALPVGQGDAFLLEREGLRVLVDGGKSSKQSTQHLNGVLPGRHLDVCVCTHNDKDHAEGIRGLLEGGAFSIGEVWLPGRWTDRLVELCRQSDAFYLELARQVEATPSHALDDEALLEEKFEDVPGDAVEGVDEELLAAIDHAEKSPSSWPYLSSYWSRPWPQKNEGLWLECINAAERIRMIAVAARDLGCKIRWFDYAEFATGKPASGGRNDLQPVNAVEITRRVRKMVPSALRFLALSVANRESLVFRSGPDGDAPGVLFTADSDLAFNRGALRLADKELVTSPHHGSEANAAAYAAVDGLVAQPGTVAWIRSDGRFQSRPGTSFLKKQAQAACTRCRGQTTPAQTVIFDGTAGSWTPATSVTGCKCK